jgi:hypothetical protein
MRSAGVNFRGGTTSAEDASLAFSSSDIMQSSIMVCSGAQKCWTVDGSRCRDATW